MNTVVFYCVLYAGGIVFLAGCVIRAARYARQPIHLRWEIYPVPHGRTGELKIMAPEILLLKGLWEFNRPMWRVSALFHWGLYLLAAGVALLCCAAVAPAAFVPALHTAYLGCGTAGAALGTVGSLGLLARRLLNRGLRACSTPADYFNLLFFAATFTLLLAGQWLRPPGSPGPLEILRGAAAFDAALKIPSVLAAGLASGAVLLAYIPMTHMAHFIAKYFTYHAVRWDERGNVPGGAIERKVAEYLMYRPTWSAAHVVADGRTWAEVATTNPSTEGAK